MHHIAYFIIKNSYDIKGDFNSVPQWFQLMTVIFVKWSGVKKTAVPTSDDVWVGGFVVLLCSLWTQGTKFSPRQCLEGFSVLGWKQKPNGTPHRIRESGINTLAPANPLTSSHMWNAATNTTVYSEKLHGKNTFFNW